MIYILFWLPSLGVTLFQNIKIDCSDKRYQFLQNTTTLPKKKIQCDRPESYILSDIKIYVILFELLSSSVFVLTIAFSIVESVY